MLTDRGMISDLDQAFEIGADAYITKPLDLMQIGKIVKAKWEKYTEQIQRFLAHFDQAQIKIIIFDDFKTNTPGIYKEVLEFLKWNRRLKKQMGTQ